MEIFAADVDGRQRELRRLMGRRNYLACVAFDPEVAQGAFGSGGGQNGGGGPVGSGGGSGGGDGGGGGGTHTGGDGGGGLGYGKGTPHGLQVHFISNSRPRRATAPPSWIKLEAPTTIKVIDSSSSRRGCPISPV